MTAGKAQRSARLNYSSAENDDVVYRVPARTVYIHRAGGSSTSYIVGVRHRRQKVAWAEAKAQKRSLEAALQSARVWQQRVEKTYQRPYRVALLPRAVLSHVATIMVGDRNMVDMVADRRMGALIADYASDGIAATATALARGRAFVPPELIPAIEAIATSGEPNRFHLVIDFLGWNGLRPGGPSFEQMLAPS